MRQNRFKVAVAGAGITGLAAAFYLNKRWPKTEKPLELYIFEQSKTPGGKIQTLRDSGFIIERGPDSFLARKPEMIQLAYDLGIEQQLVGLNPTAGSASILHDGTFHPIPKGFVLGIPTEWAPLMQTELISSQGKLRALYDLLLPRTETNEDESLGAFLERRLGKELVTQVAEPLLSGIYAGDLYRLSTNATFPQFKQVEKKYRSLILGMKQSRALTARATKVDHRLPVQLQNSAFLHFRDGLVTVIEALAGQLQQEKAQLLFGTKLNRILPTEEEGRYQLSYGGNQHVHVNAIILAVPPFHAASLLPEAIEWEKLNEVGHVSVANVVLGFEHKPAARWGGTGFLIPRGEGTFMTACTFTSDKWPHAAPAGSTLLRCYVGRSNDESWQTMTDEEISDRVRAELKELIGLKAAPDFVHVTRWQRAMPQYPPGHREFVQSTEQNLSEQLPGVFLTGAGYGGVGLPDCIRQGAETANKIIDHFKKLKK